MRIKRANSEIFSDEKKIKSEIKWKEKKMEIYFAKKIILFIKLNAFKYL